MPMHRLVCAMTVSMALAGAAAVPGAAAKTFVYVSAAADGKVDGYSMDEASGALTPLANVDAGKAVMPMAVSPDKAHLYAVVRSQPYRVLTYAIDPASGALTEEAVAALPDSMPYVSVDKSGRLLFFASYGGNKIASLPVDADGLVKGGVRQLIPTGRNAHAIVSDRTGKYLVVLHFAETNPTFSAAGKRVFKVHINDEERHGEVDVVAEAGAMTAWQLPTEVEVKGEEILLEVLKVNAGPAVKGIEVRRLPD